MAYIDVLLIGGSADGEWRSVDELPSIDVAIFPGRPVGISQLDSRPNESVVYHVERYHRQTLRGPSGDFPVYVFGDVDPIALLIGGYRKPK